MPTKPSTQPEYWATDAVYTTGPFIGQPQKVVPPGAFAAEGHRPGSLFPTPAEYENSQQNNITGLARWLFLGTFDPDADAHVVETNASGYAGLFGLTINNTLDGPTAMSLSSVNTLIPAATFDCFTGAAALQANVGTGAGAAVDSNVGAGTGIGLSAVLTGTLAGGAGVRVSTDGANAANCVEVTQSGSGRGVLVTGGTGEAAIEAYGSGNQPAVYGIGSGTGPGVIGQSSATGGSVGVYGVSGSATSFGVYGITTGGATTASAAVRGEGLASGSGVQATAVSGAAVSASASNNAGTAFYLPGKAVDPTTTFDGRMDFNTTTATWVVSNASDGAYRDLWSSRGGLVIGATTGDSATTAGGAAWITLCTLALTGSNAPRRGSVTVVLRFCGTARSTAGVGATNTLNIRIRDTAIALPATIVTYAGAGAGAGAGFFLPATPATFDWTTTIAFDVAYTIPSAGNRTFVAEIQTATANNIQVGRASLIPFGCYV